MTFFVQLRSIYTKTVRSIIARTPNPSNPYASEGIKLSDGSMFYSINEKAPDTSNCPIIPSKCGKVLTQSEIDMAERDARKYKSLGKFCGKYGVSRSFAINRLNLRKDHFEQEETLRIEKLSDVKKRGLIIKRLIRKERFKAF